MVVVRRPRLKMQREGKGEREQDRQDQAVRTLCTRAAPPRNSNSTCNNRRPQHCDSSEGVLGQESDRHFDSEQSRCHSNVDADQRAHRGVRPTSTGRFQRCTFCRSCSTLRQHLLLSTSLQLPQCQTLFQRSLAVSCAALVV